MINYGEIIAIDLSQKGEKEYRVSRSNRLWLAKTMCFNGGISTNPIDAIIGIRVADRQAAMHPWALLDGYANGLSGDFDVIYVTVIQAGTRAFLYLATGLNIVMSYCSSDGLSPSIGGGAPQSGWQGGTTLGVHSAGGAFGPITPHGPSY